VKLSKPWLKSWVNILDKPKVMRLPPSEYKAWNLLLHIAGRFDHDGVLPPIEECAFILHVSVDELKTRIETLIGVGLIDRTGDALTMHDWEDWQAGKPSDEPERVRERVYKHRAATKEAVTPSNALQNVTKSVTPSNAGNALRGEEKRVDKEETRVEVPRDARDTQTKRKRPSTPIPDPFTVTKAMNDWADEHGYSRAFLQDATEYFCDWATSHDHRYADWPSVWRRVVKSRWDEQHRNVVQMRRA
jgi:hypothetical protein